MINQGYNQYKNNAILTASPEDLTLMLFEGAIKFCNKGIIGIEKNDVQASHNSIMRVQDIVTELQITLDRKYSVAEDLDRIYDYLVRRLRVANMRKDASILEEVNEHLRELRDTWKEAMKLAKTSRAKA